MTQPPDVGVQEFKKQKSLKEKKSPVYLSAAYCLYIWNIPKNVVKIVQQDTININCM